jgi:hypothetical protein
VEVRRSGDCGRWGGAEYGGWRRGKEEEFMSLMR